MNEDNVEVGVNDEAPIMTDQFRVYEAERMQVSPLHPWLHRFASTVGFVSHGQGAGGVGTASGIGRA